MTIISPDKRTRTINIVTVSAVFLLILLLSYFCPLITDDLHFKFVWNGFDARTGQEVRVSSIWDILESARNYYTFSGGRVVCHTIVFALVNMNRWVYSVLNALMFVTAGILIRKHMKEKLAEKNRFTLPLIYISMFMLLPVWGDSVLWISGSVNYLWAGTAMLWAIYLIDKDDKSRDNQLLTCIAVLIASATNEISGGILAIILILRLIAWGKKNTYYYYTALFCVIPGMSLVLSAPGNSNRMQAVDMHTKLSATDVIQTSYGYLRYFFDWGWPFLFIIFAVMFYMIFGKQKVKDIVASMTVTVACFAGAVALGFSGIVIQRALFTVILPLLIPFWSLLPYLYYYAEGKNKLKAFLFSSGLLVLAQLAVMSFVQAGMMLLILLLTLIANILSKGRIEQKWLPSLPEQIGLTALCSVIIIANTVMFFYDVKRYDQYIDQTVTACRNADYETLYSLSPSGKISSFFPSEGTIVSDYSVSWIYEYYVMNV